jgi:hypothetical protein
MISGYLRPPAGWLPVIKEVKPVLPPAAMPVSDSMNTVMELLPTRAPKSKPHLQACVWIITISRSCVL